jgi:4-amino-4-deoxy-L-arabinose transferase-like glycosyltransferase
MSDGHEGGIERAAAFVRSHPVVLVAGVGILFHSVFFDATTINTDTGYYVYDSLRILWGETPFVDYPGRSPVFQYTLAGVLAVFGQSIVVARSFMVVVSVVLGVGIFYLTRELHSREAGIASALLFYCTPLIMVWGPWLKTEQFAGVLVVGTLLVALRGFDRDPDPKYPLVVGVGFGLAFLSRMVVVAHLLGFGLFVAYYFRTSRDRPIVATVRYGVLGGVGAVGTLAVAYLLIAWPSVSLAWAIARQHVVELFLSGGQPTIAWVPAAESGERAARAGASGSFVTGQMAGIIGPQPTHWLLAGGDLLRDPIVALLGREPVIWITYNLRLLLPASLPILVYSLWLPNRKRIPVWFLIVFLSGWFLGFWLGVIVLASVLLLWSVSALVSTSRGPSGRSAKPEWMLPAIIASVVLMGYLARNSELYETYFQDVLPFVAVLAGIALVELYRSVDVERHEWQVAVGILLLTTGVVFPFVLFPNDFPTSGRSVTYTRDVGADIRARTDPDDRVFAASTFQLIEGNRRPLADLSREYWVLRRTPNSTTAEVLRGRILADLGTERVPYALVEHRMRKLLEVDSRIVRVFDACYEKVRSDAYVYEELYRLNRTANCTSTRSSVGAGV